MGPWTTTPVQIFKLEQLIVKDRRKIRVANRIKITQVVPAVVLAVVLVAAASRAAPTAASRGSGEGGTKKRPAKLPHRPPRVDDSLSRATAVERWWRLAGGGGD